MRFLPWLLVGLGVGCSQQVTSPKPFAESSPWPKFRRDMAQTGLSTAKPNAGAKAFTFMTGKGIFSSPVIGGDGTIYIGSADRNLYAIDKTGAEKWRVETGEIIDSAGVLDDTGALYFGSGDGVLRAVEAETGASRWAFTADDPASTNAVINWFEGNVAIGPSGTLYAGNDNFVLYAIDRSTGKRSARFKMADQIWSSPAIDESGALYVGNNNLVDIYGDNTFGLNADLTKRWSFLTRGTMAASPLLRGDLAIVGSFDGTLRAHDRQSGEVKWSFATRDHLYASPALLPDGRIVQASTDGTLYCLNAESGAVEWTYELGEPIRSSPAVDDDGHIYFGAGDGRLYVINSDGSPRWAIQLIDDDRNDLNSSPALGNDAIVIGGENGGVFSVPYEACPSSSEPRCVALSPLDATARAELRFVGGFGGVAASVPAVMGATEPVGFELFVFDGTKRALATLENASLQVTVTPPVPVRSRIFGDGRYLVVEPVDAWPGEVTIAVRGNYVVDHQREGLKLSGGRVGGSVDASFAFGTAAASGRTFEVPSAPGQPQTLWELSRLALPTPTLLPSYNQIGFDSLHYVLTPIEGTAEEGVAVLIGARLKPGVAEVEVDPTTRAVIPLRFRKLGDAVSGTIEAPIGLEVMNLTLSFKTFQLTATLPAMPDQQFTARLTGSTICAQLPIYGVFLQKIGLCNPTSDEFSVSGASNLKRWSPPSFPELATARGAQAAFTRQGIVISADLSGWKVKAAEHLITVVPVDVMSGRAMPVAVGLELKKTVDADGVVTAVQMEVPNSLGRALRVHVLIDGQLVSSSNL